MPTRRFAQSGQSLVEIALVLPAAIILFLGVVEVGFFLYAQVQVANSAREGARYGSLCRLNDNCDGGSSYADLTEVVQSAVFAESQALEMTTTNTVVQVEPASFSGLPTVGTPITVTVTYTYKPPFVSGIVPMFPSSIPIKQLNVMRFDK